MKAEADEKPILAPPPDWIEVSGESFARHVKRADPTKPPSLRVDYRCGLVTHSEWVFLEHEGYPRTQAQAWWRRRAPDPVPTSVDDALARQHEIAATGAIQVVRDGQFMRVARHRLAREMEEVA